MSVIEFQCVTFERSGQYVAECVDLDISVKRKTAQEAKRALEDAMKGYLQVVLRGNVAGLLPRPSPLRSRIRYHFLALLGRGWICQEEVPAASAQSPPDGAIGMEA